MIQRLVEELSGDGRWQTVHLAFFFTPSFQSVRRFRLQKIIGLVAVWLRLVGIVAKFGRPDLLIYPSGGPQTVPVIRDVLLLPLICRLSRKVVVQFHAAGIAERLAARSGMVEILLRFAYRGVAGAIVMTDFNRRDPEALGIHEIRVLPHRLPDENPSGHLPDYSACGKAESGKRKEVSGALNYHQSTFSGFGANHTTLPSITNPPSTSDPRPSTGSGLQPPVSGLPSPLPPFNILYAGHLYELKGTPQLVEAFGRIAGSFPDARLVLMGEFLPPYSEEACRKRCRELGIETRVEIAGVLGAKEKAMRFRAAHLFVFPSVAPYESFGLVMAEAKMWGLPIVATDWRGNRDVAGPEGLYCGAQDPESLNGLATTLESVLQRRDGLPAIAAASRKRYEKFYRLGREEHDYRSAVSGILESIT